MKTVKINPATVPNPPPGTSTFGINLLDYRKWLLAEEIHSARTAGNELTTSARGTDTRSN
jgi:hypothetical protein